MRVIRVAVAAEARYGDNDYGSQRAQVELTAELDGGDDASVCQQVLLEQAKHGVLAELRSSPNVVIRRKANERPKVCSECGDAIGDFESNYSGMHPACEEALRDRRRQEREARELAAERPTGDEPADVLNPEPEDDDGDDDETVGEGDEQEQEEDQGIPVEDDDDPKPELATAAARTSGSEDDPF